LNINKFRIDPGSAASGLIKVYSITVKTSKREQKFGPDSLSRMIIPLHSLSKVHADGFVELSVLGPDPYFEFRHALSVEPNGMRIGSAILLLALSIAGFNFLAFLYEKNKYVSMNISDVTRDALIVGLLVFLPVLVISVVTPPFQSPDEFVHFERAYFISQGETNLVIRNGIVGGELDPAYLNYDEYYQEIARYSDKRISAMKLEMSRYVEWSDERIFERHFATAPYMFAVYIPQALGIKIGQILDLSIDSTYRLARLFILLVVVLCLVKAFTIVQPSLLTLTILFMPMTLFQFSAVTVDAFTIALAVLSVSIYCRSMLNDGTLTRFQFTIMMIGIVIVVTSRLYMLPLLLLPLLMVVKDPNKFDLSIFGLSVLVIILWLSHGWVHTVDTSVQFEQSRAEVATFYLRHPFQFFDIFANTLDRFGEFYVDGFIGILGWLDTRFSDAFYSISTCFLGVALVLSISLKQVKENILGNTTLIVVSISSSLLVFIALLISSASHPATLITGIQGRYFTIPALIFAYAISGTRVVNM